MVVQSAMLVVQDDQHTGLPQGIVAADGVIDVQDQALTRADVVIRMLIVGRVHSTILIILRVIAWLDEAVGGHLLFRLRTPCSEVGELIEKQGQLYS